MIDLGPEDYRAFLTGHAALTVEDGWAEPRRLPAGGLHPGLDDTARAPAGVLLEVDTDAGGLEWAVRAEGEFDVLVDGERVARSRSGDVRADLGEGRKRVRVWLPRQGHVRLGRLRLTGASDVVAVPPGPRWIAYGSSITHCRGAAGPSETWPALAATALGWSLRCLGFAGQCHLDPVVARFVRDTAADVITLCVGVNVHGHATFSARSLRPALEGFVATIRDGHPDTPILLTTPIHSSTREDRANALGLTLADVRREVAEAGHGLPVLDGTTVFGPADAGLLVDGLHPDAEGYRLIGRRMVPHLAALLPEGS